MSELSILILDDESLARFGLKEQLELSGYHRVYTAASYEEALDVYRRERPDLAVVDINLESERSGLDFLKAADELTWRIILSGYGRGQYEQELADLEYNLFLEKPITFKEVAKEIGRLTTA